MPKLEIILGAVLVALVTAATSETFTKVVNVERDNLQRLFNAAERTVNQLDIHESSVSSPEEEIFNKSVAFSASTYERFHKISAMVINDIKEKDPSVYVAASCMLPLKVLFNTTSDYVQKVVDCNIEALLSLPKDTLTADVRNDKKEIQKITTDNQVCNQLVHNEESALEVSVCLLQKENILRLKTLTIDISLKGANSPNQSVEKAETIFSRCEEINKPEFDDESSETEIKRKLTECLQFEK